MFDSKKLDELASKLCDALPGGLHDMKEDISRNFKSILQSTFAKLDLVTREEFDVQSGVLAKTREKLEQLEAVVANIEKQQRGHHD